MKKCFSIFSGLFLTLCLICAIPALAEDSSIKGMYVAPKALLSIGMGQNLEKTSHFRDDKTSTKLGGGLAIGYDFQKSMDYPFRVELEYAIRDSAHFKVNGDSIKARHPQTLMVNGYYDIHNTTDFIPYFSVGTGVAFLDKKGSFAWNVGTGISYKIDENWSTDLGYRFVRMGKFKDNGYEGNLYSNEFMLSGRYTF